MRNIFGKMIRFVWCVCVLVWVVWVLVRLLVIFLMIGFSWVEIIFK